MKKAYGWHRLQMLLLAVVLCVVAPALMPDRALAVGGATVTYQTHAQTYGWQDAKANGATAGTTGMGKRLEAIKISVNGNGVSGGISYRVHCQTYGWMANKTNGAIAGTTGQGKRLEAIEMYLTGNLAKYYDVFYRVHVQTYGWQDWVANGNTAGTVGRGKRLEAIEILLIEKAATADLPGVLNYKTHAQSYGWLDWVADGEGSGITGKGKRLESLRVYVNNAAAGVSGGVRYRSHVQTYGWQGWSYDGEISGTMGLAKRIEAVQIELTGNLAKKYDVYYQTHIQSGGWLGWAKNGESAGSIGQSLRVEAIRIVLVEKNGPAPGETYGCLYDGRIGVPIMGQSRATQEDCVDHFNSIADYPGSVYASKGAPTIKDFVRILFEEAQAEGVRADVVYAQTMLETAYLGFGNDVSVGQCNFAGIGATGNGEPGYTFPDVRTGLRVQVQHLKAYASTDPLKQKCVDPRFGYVERGVAPTLGDLDGRWATGSNYGWWVYSILMEVGSTVIL